MTISLSDAVELLVSNIEDTDDIEIRPDCKIKYLDPLWTLHAPHIPEDKYIGAMGNVYLNFRESNIWKDPHLILSVRYKGKHTGEIRTADFKVSDLLRLAFDEKIRQERRVLSEPCEEWKEEAMLRLNQRIETGD